MIAPGIVSVVISVVFVYQTVQCKDVWQVIDLSPFIGYHHNTLAAAVLRADTMQPKTHSQPNQKQFHPQGATFNGFVECIHCVNQFAICIEFGHCTTTGTHPLYK